MIPSLLPKSPRENANCISKLLFFWLIQLFRLGWSRDLELADLYRVPSNDRSESLGNKLEAAWEQELLRSRKNKNRQPSLLCAISKVFGLQYASLGLIVLFEECFLKIMQPVMLGYLLRYFGGEFQTELDGYLGIVFASGLVAATSIYTIMHHPFYFETLHCGMRVRVACSSIIYRKALRLSQSSLQTSSIGQMVNLLSNDVNRFDIGTGMLHYIWVGPLQLAIVVYILWAYFGWPCLAGVALLVLFVPFQSQMGRLFGKLRGQVAVRTDKRVRIMNEIISAMRIIKMYTWERPFALLVAESREDEIKFIKKTSILKAVNLSLFYISSKIIVFLTLLSYVLTGNYLTAEKVFVTLSLYNNVRLIMTLFFPNGISQLAEMIVSCQRLQNFLLMEDRVVSATPPISPQLLPSPSSSLKQPSSTASSECGIRLENIFAKWDATCEEPTLAGISFQVKPGKLLGIIGPVGCGKGSLLQAILRELPITSGSLHVSGRIVYTSQDPWIFGGSVRDNITFGLDFDPERYERTIQTCSLDRDLTLLPYGDKTLVGDRGTSLSGGQKARLNLARAVYSDADIYLLDDPLSAVDAEVGRHLFENCILSTLKDKVRILVTHQLQFLKAADELILMKGGKMEAKGTYTDLLKSGINFAQLLRQDEGGEDGLGSLGPGTEGKEGLGSLKYKGTGIEVLGGRKNSQVGQPQFRRSASMSMLEMGALSSSLVPEEFEWEEEPSIVKSYGQNSNYDGSRRMSKPLVPIAPKLAGRSSKSQGSTGKDNDLESTPLLPKAHEEGRSTGEITLGLYWRYIRAGSSRCGIVTLALTNILVQILFSGTDYFLQYWTQQEEARLPDAPITTFNATTTINASDAILKLDLGEERQRDVYIYSALLGLLFLVSLVRTAGFLNMCLTSSINLHKHLFNGVLRAPMRFFEINPVGRILNRFAKDCGIVDETLPPTLFDTMDICLQFFGVVVIVSSVNLYLLIPSVVLATLFYFMRRFYLETARSIKRLEGISRSPVFSHLSTSLYGLTTIRAFGVEEQFINQFDSHQDLHSSSWYLFLATARLLGIFVDWTSVLYTASITFSFLLMKQDSAAAGLAISSAMTLTGMLQWGVRQSAETENQMVSVERVLEYAALEPEAALESPIGVRPPKSWPLKGNIEFKKVTLTYGNVPVLQEITCTFKPKEKVGIVGRTGAGKSSLITALFRIAEPCSGSIEIDGINVLYIGLHELRSKLSNIPQDPVLFMGTLRRNLDPFKDYDDDELWQVLQEVHLAESVRDMPIGLDTQIAEGGSNFSVGQRQLICLGRAILKRNKILILDEATANVDPETDALIQKTIREKFADCTVITVAHRLQTVMDSDRILVLDAGRIEEFDEPYKLLLNRKSSLHQLVQQTGKATAASLINIAKQVHDRKQKQKMGSVTEFGENGSGSSIGSSTNDGGANQDDVF